jgi:8-oxo-dGTP pyrophosphatase MutT (NUDIX family)
VLDLDLSREGTPPVDAATLIVVRDGARGIEVFCVERSKQSRFLGGAIVFPGGKLDAADRDPAWRDRTNEPHAPLEQGGFAGDVETLRALAVAACRESLEEAAILPVEGEPLPFERRLELRSHLAEQPNALLELVRAARIRLDLAALHPFARWITPVQEPRRYDTRFFLTKVAPTELGAHDEQETMSSFWARPADVLERFARAEVQLAPPTHRSLEVLSSASGAAGAIALAQAACLDPICPKLVVQGESLALTLPGDPEHDVKASRVPGRSRFVLRDGRWWPENAP